ncbi:hypothetical protein D9758_013553 [Tetrapyrgos nigripes]|uniref:CFEM domain-containing protein n=1 Tax=Tetrapyrgos nigripes TaxID=182062 RepID=A0A8H5CH20_9AGAR|nr:hypothetical protein D9758_013553 [Tetrapyrgos nigripes]
MRFSIIFICSALPALASASPTLRLQSRVPDCAATCIQDTNPPAGCSADDNTCLCNSNEYVYMTSNCIEDTCSADESSTGMNELKAVCEDVGVALTLPVPVQKRAPDCATTCIQDTNPPAECSADDNTCLCNSDEFVYMSSNCIQDTCSSDEAEAGINELKATCGRVGVAVKLPVPVQ